MAKSRPSESLVRVPLVSHTLFGLRRLLIPLRLLLRKADGTFLEQDFLLDTCTTFTHIPIPFANRARIAFSRQTPLTTATIMGRKKDGGFLSPLVFALTDLPQWEFETQACFSMDVSPSKMPLLSASDLLQQFTVVMSPAPQQAYPAGFMLLQLRDDHSGRPRRRT